VTKGQAVEVRERRLAERWAAAIADDTYVPMSADELTRYLAGLAETIRAVLASAPFDPEPARQVGHALVEAHFTGSAALGSTLLLLAKDPDLAAVAREDHTARMVAVQAAVADGYATALRERTLREQESIRVALVEARGQVERALSASQARFRAVFAEAAIGIAVLDGEDRIAEVNQALAVLLNVPAEEMVGRLLTEFTHPDDATGLADAIRQLLAGKGPESRASRIEGVRTFAEHSAVQVEKRFTTRSGTLVWGRVTLSAIESLGEQPYAVAMVEDITERRLLELRLEYQASHDPLTGLANRDLFYQRLGEVLADPTPDATVGLCYLDLDGFKVVNDTFGHEVGDGVLVAVAQRLDLAIRRTGCLVARMGGDEFVILVGTGSDGTTAEWCAERVIEALRGAVRVGGHELAVTASVGVVDRPVAGLTPAELMQAADTTLYWAKSGGRGRWAVFDPERHAREVARYTLAATMPAAVEHGEFVVDYQPLVGLADNRLRGVEALVRWRHPRLGLLAPDEFIALAEETGAIVSLGRWVLTSACQQIPEWQELAGDDFFVSVNLAVRQAHEQHLTAEVADVLKQTGVAPHQLMLELTESAIMGPAAEPLRALQTLSDMGVRLAIDDFGTGYSNLVYLRQLPVHALKIAGSFVAGMATDAGGGEVDERIVATLVDLAHALDLMVIAEGVETDDQASRLRALTCDIGQGWHYAKPEPPESITERLRAQRR
jgi:diguanylate cyclase (GGDEF)-like protein